VIGAAGLVAFVALSVLAAPGDCPEDAPALAAEADLLIAEAGPSPDASTLERARRLYRRARVLLPTPEFSLRAADLACAAGDEEECGDLLSEAAETSSGGLTPADRLLLARRAELRRAWREAISQYQALRAATNDAGLSSWAEEKIRRLEVEVEAQSIAAPAAAPPPEARLLLAEARRALAAGDLPKARERLAIARRLSPGYPEAALVLAALETREGRAPEAIRAYREALATDPARFEALVGLANLLWDEPDRSAKEEALSLTDRALAARPDAPSLLKTSAVRWAEWGDAPKALARIDAYRRRASPEEKRATESLRESLARRVDALLSGRTVPEESSPIAELSSPAVDEWKVAQAYVRRGDPASLAAALEHLREAERLDPTFAPAPELAGAVHVKLGDLSLAQKAYERAIGADPTRAATYERLAFLLARQPGREAEADEAWRRAEQAGSSEALFALAESAARKGRRGEALALYRRYLGESPAGVHGEEASRSIERLESGRRTSLGAVAIAAAALLVIGSVVGYRRFGGRTFAEWIRAHPARAREARPIVGRLRHEVVKHGGLLLADAAKRLSEPDAEARRRTAALLLSRLYESEKSNRDGLIPQSFETLARLKILAREDGYRLNLEHKDPLFSPVARAAMVLAPVAGGLTWLSTGPELVPDRIVRRVVGRLERAAALFGSVRGAEISRLVDQASSTRVNLSALQDVLGAVCAEKGIGPPPILEWHGPEIAVRVDRADLETIWRNLFANAIDAAEGLPVSDVRLGVFAELRRDPVTGAPVARVVLADNVPRPLTADMIRGRGADRGWGVVADLLRRHDGSADVSAPPAAGYVKGIVIEVPAVETGMPS
jgi:tetratricopeptide (TPR) repeat protein